MRAEDIVREAFERLNRMQPGYVPPRAKVDIPFDNRFTSPIVDYRRRPDGVWEMPR